MVKKMIFFFENEVFENKLFLFFFFKKTKDCYKKLEQKMQYPVFCLKESKINFQIKKRARRNQPIPAIEHFKIFAKNRN